MTTYIARPEHAGMRMAVAVAAALASSSCSLVFQERVPEGWSRKQEPRCTATPGWALWDGLLTAGDLTAAGLLIAAAAAYKRIDDPLTFEDERYETSTTEKTLYGLAAISAAFGLGHAVSAGFGFHWAGECEEARRTHDAWEERHEDREIDAGPPPPRRWEDRGVPPPLTDDELADAGTVERPALDGGSMSLPE